MLKEEVMMLQIVVGVMKMALIVIMNTMVVL